jgi:hypothetical protein
MLLNHIWSDISYRSSFERIDEKINLFIQEEGFLFEELSYELIYMIGILKTLLSGLFDIYN